MWDVVAQWIEWHTAVLHFRGSILVWFTSGIPNLEDHLLGREPGVPWTCDRCRSTVQTSAVEEEDFLGGTEITAVKAGVFQQRWSQRLWENVDGYMRRWSHWWAWKVGATPKQQLPRTETMGKLSTHNIVSRMTEEGWKKKEEKSPKIVNVE